MIGHACRVGGYSTRWRHHGKGAGKAYVTGEWTADGGVSGAAIAELTIVGPVSDLTVTAKDATSTTLAWTVPEGAVAIELQESADGISGWTAIEAGRMSHSLTAGSTGGVISGVDGSVASFYRLVVTGGYAKSTSNMAECGADMTLGALPPTGDPGYVQGMLVAYMSDNAVYATQTVAAAGDTVGVLPAEPNKAGYQFAGWFTAASGRRNGLHKHHACDR